MNNCHFDSIHTEMCAAGSSSTTGNHPGCESCPAGTYQDECGQTSCIVCPNNMTSPAGSDSLTDCYGEWL